MNSIYDRTRMLLGAEAFNRIQARNVIIFGLGGAGDYAAEALVRAGIQKITLVDQDKVDLADFNRQLLALHSTLGKRKADVMRARILDINPAAEVKTAEEAWSQEYLDDYSLQEYDYIIDAMDQISDKLLLILKAKSLEVPILSVMSTGNKFDPTQLKIGEIKKVKICPMAKDMRKELAKSGIKELKVIYSNEIPHREELPEDGSRTASSISFLPAAAGLLAASEVVKDFLLWAPGDKMIFGIKKPTKKIKVEY